MHSMPIHLNFSSSHFSCIRDHQVRRTGGTPCAHAQNETCENADDYVDGWRKHVCVFEKVSKGDVASCGITGLN